MGRSSTDSEKSSFADTENLLDHEQPQANDQPGRNRTRFLFAFNCIFAILNFTLLVSLISNLVPWSGKAVQLPSHEWSKEATKIELRPFDDVFHDHYSVYRGEPRPELDHAWMKLLRGYTVRIPAPGWYGPSRPNGTIVELLDGSGDTLATPAVLHQLHCLRLIREYMVPEAYPKTYETYKPPEGKKMSVHMDHCIDMLRQSTMCSADMTMVMYEWWDETVYPQNVVYTPHVCANWERVSDWIVAKGIHAYGDIVRHPKTGEIPYPLKSGKSPGHEH